MAPASSTILSVGSIGRPPNLSRYGLNASIPARRSRTLITSRLPLAMAVAKARTRRRSTGERISLRSLPSGPRNQPSSRQTMSAGAPIPSSFSASFAPSGSAFAPTKEFFTTFPRGPPEGCCSALDIRNLDAAISAASMFGWVPRSTSSGVKSRGSSSASGGSKYRLAPSSTPSGVSLVKKLYSGPR